MDRFGGSADEHYLELSKNEKDMLQAVNDAGFKKVIVLLHSANPMQMDFLNDYNVDAVVWGARYGYGHGRYKRSLQTYCRRRKLFGQARRYICI